VSFTPIVELTRSRGRTTLTSWTTRGGVDENSTPVSSCRRCGQRDGTDEGGSLVLASGFPQGSSSAWRVYSIRGADTEALSATEGLRWLAVRPDGQELAGVVHGRPGEPGKLLVEPVPDS